MPGSRWLLALLAIATLARPCAAQTERPAVLIKGGANFENAEDGLRGTSPAFGADVLFPLGERWTFDVEFWLPGYFTTDTGGRHRDVLWSIGVLRAFGHGRTRPFISFGIGGARTQQRDDFFGNTDTTTGYFTVGFGADIRVTDRVSVVPEVRASLSAASALLRPSIGVAYRF